MFVFDDADSVGGGTEPDDGRVNGEYRFSSRYGGEMYSDAHFVREEEKTVPPRYYVPPERPEKEPAKRSTKKKGTFGKILAFLMCALLGGVIGSALTASKLSARLNGVELGLSELQSAQEKAAPAVLNTPLPAPAGTPDALPAATIYDNSCKHTVGVSTEVTFTNFFGMSSSSAVTGTGFIVSPAGYIITNYHIISPAYEGKSDVEVILSDGQRYPAAIVGVEEDNDLAVLKIDGEDFPCAVLGNSDTLQVGDTVYAVGNPLGELEFSMSIGHVSALDRLINTAENIEAINMMQIDAAVNRGNSGGPLYNDRGEVVGIVTAKYTSDGVEGIGFAIPINDAVVISNDLITKGYVTGKAYLGVRIDERYNAMYSRYYGMPLGAYVSYVERGSCAETAGLQAGDIITAIGGEEITGNNDLHKALRHSSAGDEAEITLYRAGETITVKVVYDEAQPA